MKIEALLALDLDLMSALTLHTLSSKNLIASWKGTEASLVFSSGYVANMGTLSALLKPEDLAVIDERVHPCIWEGAKLSNAQVIAFKHNDCDDIERAIASYLNCTPQTDKIGKILVVSQSVFSMEGDRGSLSEIKQVADKHNATLYVGLAEKALTP